MQNLKNVSINIALQFMASLPTDEKPDIDKLIDRADKIFDYFLNIPKTSKFVPGEIIRMDKEKK